MTEDPKSKGTIVLLKQKDLFFYADKRTINLKSNTSRNKKVDFELLES